MASVILLAPAIASGDESAGDAAQYCSQTDVRIDEGETARRVVRACNKAILAFAESDTPKPVIADLYVSRAVAWRRIGKLAASLADLDKAIAIDESPLAIRMRAWTLRQGGRYAEAERDLTRSLELEEHWQGYLSRCVVRLDQRRTRDARPDCEQALELRPSEDGVYFAALAQAETGDTETAIVTITKGFARGIESDRTYALLVQTLRANRRFSDAQEALDEGRERYPDSLLLQEF